MPAWLESGSRHSADGGRRGIIMEDYDPRPRPGPISDLSHMLIPQLLIHRYLPYLLRYCILI